MTKLPTKPKFWKSSFVDSRFGVGSDEKVTKNTKSLLFFQGPEITWRQLMCKLLGLPSDTIFYDNLLGMYRQFIFFRTTVVRSYNEISVTLLFEQSVAYESTRLTKMLFSNSIFYFKFSFNTAFRFGKHFVFFDNFNFWNS